MRRSAAVARVPGYRAGGVTAGILVALGAARSTCRIFPLGLGGQAERHVKDVAQTRNELLSLLPRDIVHRQLQIATIHTVIVAHDRLPQFLCHLVFADAVGGQHRAVYWRFVGIGRGALLLGSALLKGAAVDVLNPELDIAVNIGNLALGDDDRNDGPHTRGVVLDVYRRLTLGQCRQRQRRAREAIADDAATARCHIVAAAVHNAYSGLLAHLHLDDTVGDHHQRFGVSIVGVTRQSQSDVAVAVVL